MYKKRCFGQGKDFYEKYHDEQWAVPVHDDQLLFEMLILEGAQAGLSWETILKRQQGYRDVFYHFDVVKVAAMTDHELDELRNNEQIIRNRLKIYSTRQNAQVFIKIQQEFGSFHQYVWNFVGHKPIINAWQSFSQVPAKTEISDALSKDLQKRGMKFVGSTIIYAYMQAVGLVDDHIVDCWLRNKN